MNTRILFVVLGLAACGDDGGSSVGGVDSPPIPVTVTVAGTTSSIGLGGRMPISGVAVAAYREGETTPVAMTTSEATTGKFSLTITTEGVLDGYLKGTLAGNKDTYLYPAGPLTGDISNVPLLMLTQGTFDSAAAVAQTPQDAGKGWIGVQVYTTDNMPVADAVVTTSPMGVVRFSGPSGLPNKNTSMTAADGVAYVFSVAAGPVVISATGGGLTFKSHTLNARADQVTLTLIQP